MNTLNQLFLTIILLFCFSGNVIAENNLIDRQVIVMFEHTTVSLPDQIVRTDRIDQVTMPDNVRTVLIEVSIQEIEKGFPDFRSEDTLRVLSDGRIYRVPDWSNLFIITLPENVSRDSLIIKLDQLPYVVYAEKNQMVIPRGEVIPPNQQHFDDQWGLKNQQFPGEDIRATYAWSLTTGSSGNILGVVDSGVQSSHDDLTGKVSGPAAFTGDFGGDHGTLVAGVAAAHGDNFGGGIAGVDWHVEVHAEELGSLTQTAQAIDGAVNAGAIVINNSWGYENTSTTLSLALRSAYENGVLLVHANPYKPNTPGASPAQTSNYPNNLGPWILNVGATSIDGSEWEWTGSKAYTDVAAPGEDIISTSSQSGTPYRTVTGTSFAAPHVAGTATLMLSVNPDLKNYDIKQILMRTAREYPIHDPEVGYGLINAEEALRRADGFYEFIHGDDGNLDQIHNNVQRTFVNSPGFGLSSGTYIVDVWEFTVDASFDHSEAAWAWLEEEGFSAANPNSAERWSTESISSSQMEIKTYFYFLRTRLGASINTWVPFDPTARPPMYTVTGLPKEIGGPNEEITLYGGFTLEADQNLTILAGTELNLHGDLVVEEYGEMHIQEGVTINAQPGSKILTEGDGRLLAFGSPENPIVMQGDGGGSWDGVVFNSSSNLLNNVHIKDVGGYQAAIRILGGSGNVVTSSTIEDNFYGILVDNVDSVIITGNHIVNNQNEGLLLLDVINEPSSPNTVWIRDNTIANNGYSGVYLSNSLIHDFSGNVIEDNQGYGIWMSPFSTIYFNYQDEGRNRIKNNNIHQIWLASTGDAFIGGLYTQGQNSIYHTNQPSSNKYIYRMALTGQGYSQSPYDVFAWQTYWGQYAADFGGPAASWFVGNVDYSNHLTSDPTGGSGASSGEPLLAGGSGEGQTTSLMSADMVAAVTGGDRESSLDPQRAVQLAERVMHLRDELVNHPGDYYSARRINELFTIKMFDIHDDMGLHCNITHTFEEWSDDDSGVLAQYQGDQAEHVQLAREAAILQRVRLDLHQGDVASALQKADRYGSQVANRDHRHALVHGLLSVAMRSGEYGAAKDLLAELELFEPEREVAGWYEAPDYRPLADYLAYAQKRSGDKGGTVRLARYEGSSNLSEGIAAAETLPDQFALSSNYPNPFNPVTVIPFTLPMQADVLIEVFDISGRRVARITDRQYEAGHHQVSFDAGSLASGVYLIRAVMRSVEGGDHQFTRKMALVK